MKKIIPILPRIKKSPYFNRERPAGFTYLNVSSQFNNTIPLLEQFDIDDLELYPVTAIDDLRQQIATKMNIEDKNTILIGNGCMDLLHGILRSSLDTVEYIITIEPGYFMYDMWCSMYNKVQKKIPILKNLKLPIDSILSTNSEYPNSMLLLCAPNSPTGNGYSLAEIEDLLDKFNGTVIIDETYYFFSDSDYSKLINKFSNLILLRSFSKVGMAGLRLGYLLTNLDRVHTLQSYHCEFQTSSLVANCATKLLEDSNLLFDTIKEITERREHLVSELKKNKKLIVHPSQTDFINISHQDFTSSQLYNFLHDQKILTQPLHYPPVLENCVRVNIGSTQDNLKLINALL